MKTLLLGTTVLIGFAATTGSSAFAQGLSFGEATITFNGGLRHENLSIDRGGAWSGPASESQASVDLELQSVNIGMMARFENGSYMRLGYGRVTSIEGRNYGYNGQGSTVFSDGEGDVFGVAVGAQLGGGFSIEGGVRRFDMKATEFAQPNNNLNPCPVTPAVNNPTDNCQFTHVMVTGDVVLSYTAGFAGNAFYTVGGGMRFTNGYSQYEAWNTDGSSDNSRNVAPLFSVDPVLSGSVGYQFGGFEAVAGAMLVGREVSYSLGVSMATGSRDMAEPLSGAFSVGAYAEYNQFGAKRQVAWQAEALLSDADYGEISTEISSAGLYGVFSTDVTDVRVALGSITGGEGRFAGNQRNPGNVFKMSDPTGVHASLGVHTDVMTIGQGILRRDVEIDYTDIEFGQVDLVSGNANRTWDRARTQTLTTAVGASYHMGFTPALNGYAGVDLLTSASRNLFEDIPVSSNNSNYTSGFETSYRVRLGGSYDLNGVTADFEVSGNHIAGASVAGGVTWTF